MGLGGLLLVGVAGQQMNLGRLLLRLDGLAEQAGFSIYWEVLGGAFVFFFLNPFLGKTIPID